MVALAPPTDFAALDAATTPPATAQSDPLQTPLPLPTEPAGPQTHSDQYQHEGETLSNPTPAISEHHMENTTQPALPPEKWEQTPPNVVTGNLTGADKLYREYTIALAAISLVQPTPDQILNFLRCAALVNLRPVISPNIWFSEEGLRLWYEEIARMPRDATHVDKEMLNIQRICANALSTKENPNAINMHEMVKEASNAMLSGYASRIANAERTARNRESNRRAQMLFQLRKKHLGADFKEDSDSVEERQLAWKGAIKQRDEAMAQWNDYVKSKREEYQQAKNALHLKLHARDVAVREAAGQDTSDE